LRKKSNIGGVIFMVIFIAIIGAVVFVYNSSLFERNAPVINIQSNGYWNMKSPLPIELKDESGIKHYKVVALIDNQEVDLATADFAKVNKDIKLEVKPKRELFSLRVKELTIRVEAVDASKWNFMKGNENSVEYKLKIDKKKPMATAIINSYAIRRGGSAVVIFRASDANLDELYIQTNFGKKFKPEPFYKEGYYISLVAWPVMQSGFKAEIIAKDKAGNVRRAYIPYYLRERHYKTSKITLHDKFLNGKIADLAYDLEETQGVDDKLEKFKIINEKVREHNEDLIHKITSKVSDEQINSFSIKPFYPLKNAQVVAQFGDHRFYYYNGEEVSSSYHLGLDLASVKMGKIRTMNPSNVVFTGDNGIYGNMPVLSHKLGLYTIYGHCSSIHVQEGDHVPAKGVIANTGTTGLALGDHLHFGVLVQGIEVRPQEWMDKHWIKINITDVIKNGKRIINRTR